MSIFDRLYDIARAELNHRMPGDSATWKVKSEWSYQPPPEDPEPSRHTDREPPPRAAADPLAEHYAALEIPPGSDFETIRKAWKDQLRKYHPDRFSTDPDRQKIAHQVTQDLNRAYAVLKKHHKTK